MNWFPERSTVCLAEVPGEISLSIVLAGCSHKCPQCHSPEYQDKDVGEPLDLSAYKELLLKYKRKCSCVVFFNGEYDSECLSRMAWAARLLGYKAALYSGFDFEELPEDLTGEFTYIKTGMYREELGGLDAATTNQRMLRREADGSWTNITSEFWR